MFDDASLATAEMDSPIGPLRLAAIDDGLRAILFPVQTDIVLPAVHGSRAARAHISATQRALEQYFAGQPRAFDALTLAPAGTAFQHQVWRALRRIPFGETRSYRDIAEQIDNPKGVRAVGLANGRNPIPVIVPCHRVIGSNGTLTGFAGGLPTKKWLLEFENPGTLRLL